MKIDESNILRNVSKYYSKKILTFGEVPKGVDWASAEGQNLRFEQLSNVINDGNDFSITDLGCGYGAYWEYLLSKGFDGARYLGLDISEDMIRSAREKFSGERPVFECSATPPQVSDYVVSSGIFNVRLDFQDSEWLEYILDTVKLMNKYSRRGFSFNCLTSFSDEDKKRDYLYYTDPMLLFNYCKSNFSRNVALLHDYELYEFTIIVRK